MHFPYRSRPEGFITVLANKWSLVCMCSRIMKNVINVCVYYIVLSKPFVNCLTTSASKGFITETTGVWSSIGM